MAIDDVVDIASRSPLIPTQQARLPRSERRKSGQRFGAIVGSDLASIITERGRGELRRWADLCTFMLEDAEVLSLYSSRIDRVAQADWIIAPNEHGDQRLAQQAADFVEHKILARINSWGQSMRRLLGACGPGLACAEAIPARDRDAGYWYYPELEHYNLNRFRYGDHWDLRLYDRGRQRGPDGRGAPLQPNAWIVHEFPVQDGPPSTYGLLTATAWPWLFMRFTDKSEILLVEKSGHPTAYAIVPQGTEKSVREAYEEGLRQLSYEHVAVIEEPAKLEVLDTKGKDNIDVHERAQDRFLNRVTRLWHGASDANQPGDNGARAAVEGRIGAFTDPKMVNDGDLFSSTMHQSLFRHAIWLNSHLFDVPFEHIPIPTMRFRTADDEIDKDEGDAAEEARESGERPTQVQVPRKAPVPEDSGSSQPDGAPNLGGDQIEAMVKLVERVQSNGVPRQSAVAILRASFPQLSMSQAEEIVPMVQFPSTRPAAIARPAQSRMAKGSKRDGGSSNLDAALDAMANAERVIICGGPRCGKSTLAARAGERYGIEVRHTDLLLAEHTDDKGRVAWSAVSSQAQSMLDEEPPWILEGVACVRALRKWLKANPGSPLDATVVYLSTPVIKQSKGQVTMAKGVATIWAEIVDAVGKRGASVFEI